MITTQSARILRREHSPGRLEGRIQGRPGWWLDVRARRPVSDDSVAVLSTELEYWLSVMTGRVPQPADDFLVIAFPNARIRAEYLEVVSDRAESEVRRVLANMLGKSRSLPEWDALQVQILKAKLPESVALSELADDSLGSRPRFTHYETRPILAVAGKSIEPTWPGLRGFSTFCRATRTVRSL